MRTVKYESLRPDEIVEERARAPVVYLPVAPLEWHGPHLPVGMDAINAYAVSLMAAKRTGGVVMPPLYFGTERARTPELLRNTGFTEGEPYMTGQDFPANSILSMYSPEDIFGVVVREYLRMLVKLEYRLIVLVNGHGSQNQVETLQRLAHEYSNETDCRVLYTCALNRLDDTDRDYGHATRMETAITLHLAADSVDLAMLPPKPEKIYYTETGIVDGEAFAGRPTPDHSVDADPRDATAELGRRYVEHSAALVAGAVMESLKQIS